MTAENDLTHFLKNPENALEFNGLVEDIRGALMDYQVCALESFVFTVPNICHRLRYNAKSTTRAVVRLCVSLLCASAFCSNLWIGA